MVRCSETLEISLYNFISNCSQIFSFSILTTLHSVSRSFEAGTASAYCSSCFSFLSCSIPFCVLPKNTLSLPPFCLGSLKSHTGSYRLFGWRRVSKPNTGCVAYTSSLNCPLVLQHLSVPPGSGTACLPHSLPAGCRLTEAEFFSCWQTQRPTAVATD